MSKHPIGPWSETVLSKPIAILSENLIDTSLYKGVGYSVTEWPYTPINFNVSDTRTGYNGGGASAEPRSASRSITEVEVGREASAYLDYYNQLIDTKNYRRVYNLRKFATIPINTSSAKYTAKNLTDLAFASFIEKSNSDQFTGLAFAGEFASFKNDVHFLVNLITGRHNSAYKSLVKNLLQRKPKSVKDVLQVAADHWLQYQFGIAPDIHDLTTLMKQMDAVRKHEVREHKVVGRFVDHSTDSSQYVQNEQRGIFKFDFREETRFRYVGKFGATLKIQFDSTKPTLSQRFGVGLEDFVPALWELLPGSWLVDYFTNIGDFMNLLALRRGVYEHGWKLSIIERNSSVTYTPIAQNVSSNKNILKFSSTSGVSKIRSFAFNRDPAVVDTYVPSFRFESPNLRQVANIAAVATLLVKKSSTNSYFQMHRDHPTLFNRG